MRHFFRFSIFALAFIAITPLPVKAQGDTLAPPIFSHSSGFYSTSFELTISASESNARIIYTLDGSLPIQTAIGGSTYRYKNQWPQNPGNPFGPFLTGASNTYEYNRPLRILSRASDPDSLARRSSSYDRSNYYFPNNPVNKGTVVRARTVKEGFTSSPVVTATYFINPQGRDRYTFPVISIATNEEHLFDYHTGIYTPGVIFDQWRQSNPGQTADGGKPGNYNRRGDDWERTAHFTFFESDQTVPAISQDVGIRTHGGWSRALPMKSLRIYARSEYGESRLNHPVFQDANYDKYKRLVLRNSGNDWNYSMFRDALIQKIISPMHFDTQDYRPAILFINGEYWGVHNIRERYDQHYINRVYGVDEEQIDMLTNNASVDIGENRHYIETINYIRNNGVISKAHYEHIKTRLDLESFIDYQIANIFAGNGDWPGNNISYWRKRTDSYQPDSLYGHDGRWRWMAFDMDFGFDLYGNSLNQNFLSFATQAGNSGWPNPDWSTFLLRTLLQNEEFKTQFISRFSDMLNSLFLPSYMHAILDTLSSRLRVEMPEHITRWKRPNSIDSWVNQLNRLRNFMSARPEIQRNHLRNFFSLSGALTINVDISAPTHGYVKVNTLDIKAETPGVEASPYPWRGIYFHNLPVRLEAIPNRGYTFSHWEGIGAGIATSPVIVRSPNALFQAKAVFIPVETDQLVSYFYFGTNIDNNMPLQSIEPVYDLTQGTSIRFHSSLAGYPFNSDHPDWRKASLERRNAPTGINYRPEGYSNQPYNEEAMRGIQVKQPFTSDGGENSLFIQAPTSGLKNIVLQFAAMDEGAADALLIDYSTAFPEPIWTSEGLENTTWPLSGEFQLYTIDFTGLPNVDDNAHFTIRIRFAGDSLNIDNGNRVTFNNISLDGILMATVNMPPLVKNPLDLQYIIEEGDPLTINLNHVFTDPDGDAMTFSASSSIPGHVATSINHETITLSPLKRGEAVIQLTASDGLHFPAIAEFRVLVYPKAFQFSGNDFQFTDWALTEPEYSYPENMIFLQSDVDDPGLHQALLFPYFVAHNDYHGDDQDNIGFPYASSGRTRINALGNQGISFINTGRGRDLGGALLAVNTNGMNKLQLEWTGGTVFRNSRIYAIRLQYRTSISEPFTDLLINNQFQEYLTNADGHSRKFGPVSIPQALLGKEYLQLLWKYYHVSGNSGARAELRLDDIMIGATVGIHPNQKTCANIYADGNSIIVEKASEGMAMLSVYTMTGQQLLNMVITGSGRHSVPTNMISGVYIVRIMEETGIISNKLLIGP